MAQILVVDDSATVRNEVSTFLTNNGLSVEVAVDGKDGLDKLQKNPSVKLVISDVNMPNMDGFELVQNIRVKYEKSDLVVIGLSGESEGSLSAKFIKNTLNDFIHHFGIVIRH